MPLLAVTNLQLSYGDRHILDGVSLSIEPGERVGVVGRNGTGKSSLLRAITGELKPDAGSVALSAGARLGYLPQDPVLDGDRTLREEAATAFEERERVQERLERVFHEMESAEGDGLDRLLKEQARLEHELELAGGHAVDHQIDAVLHGLGFDDARFDVHVRNLSGGQKGRLALAKLLLRGTDVALLDEPTNHLDIAGCIWLETFLKDEYRGAVLMISHDRYLLDNVVTRIVEVEPEPSSGGGRLIDYPGNYAAFRRLRAERREAQLRAWEKQQTAFKREEAFIAKYKAGQRAKQARGRESRLERTKAEQTIERPLEVSALRLNLPNAERTGDIVASARGLGVWFDRPDGGRTTLFHDLDITIERGQRWGVIGPNGAGKSTLVRCILGESAPTSGSVNLGTKLAIGYYKQSHDDVDPEKSVARYLQDVVRRECPNQLLSEQAARDLAGAFLFSGAEQEKELGLLSGGERSRAVLAGLFASAKNVLVLDEPTNHLDIPSAERLEQALRRPPTPDEIALDENAAKRAGGFFDGTLILISHDRALLDATCQRLIVLDGRGNARVFLGTYSQWEHAEREQREAADRNGSAPSKAKPRAPARPPAEPHPKTPAPGPSPADAQGAGKAKSKWSWMKLDQLEEKIGFYEAELADIDAQLNDPDIWRDLDKANALTDRRDELKLELEGLETEWLRKAD